MSDRDGRSGVFGVFRRSAANLTAALGDRVELFSIELQEETEQLVRSFFWTALMFFFAVNACIFLSLALVFSVGVSHRLIAFSALGVFYATATGAVYLVVRRRRRDLKRPFTCTVEQLRRDSDIVEN